MRFLLDAESTKDGESHSVSRPKKKSFVDFTNATIIVGPIWKLFRSIFCSTCYVFQNLWHLKYHNIVARFNLNTLLKIFQSLRDSRLVVTPPHTYLPHTTGKTEVILPESEAPTNHTPQPLSANTIYHEGRCIKYYNLCPASDDRHTCLVLIACEICQGCILLMHSQVLMFYWSHHEDWWTCPHTQPWVASFLWSWWSLNPFVQHELGTYYSLAVQVAIM